MNSSEPKVAVLIGCYNHGKYIIPCVESVLEQNYSNVDIYISDDCSKDNTVNVINDYIKKYDGSIKIQFVPNSQNLGVAGNYNSLIQWALLDKDVKYVIPFAGDDLMLKDKISKQVRALDAEVGKHLCYSNMQWFESATGRTIVNHFNIIFKPSNSIYKIIAEALIPTPTLCIRREALESISYNDNLPYINDYLLTVEIALLGDGVVYIPEILVRYRKHGASIMDTTLFLEERVEAADIIIRKYGEKYRVASEHFAETAKFDYLMLYVKSKNYKRAFISFTKLVPRFFSSRKWFFRLIKFLLLLIKK